MHIMIPEYPGHDGIDLSVLTTQPRNRYAILDFFKDHQGSAGGKT
tara:strand:+ start:912 stop:1046 length:135 start_codon:yes stop_codon:yes gene_type:complete